jgi:hypothetical protein
MANDNGNPNPNIVEAGKETQFGQPDGVDPKEARAKGDPDRHSIRRQITRITGLEIGDFLDLKSQKEIFIQAAQKLGYKSEKNMTYAQVIAVRKLSLAIAGNVKAMKEIEDSVDGKLVEKRMESKVSLEDLVNESFKDKNSDGETS